MNHDQRKYLSLLAEKFPTRQAVCTEIINLAAIMNLPKGTEHFMSDIHGEYEAFLHIMNNCSGVIREKIELLFADSLSDTEQRDLRTLIYYPKEKLRCLHSEGKISPQWYRKVLRQMIEIARLLSSKYTRSKVRKAMPREFGYIIDELLHALPDEDGNQLAYHERILDTIVGIQNGDEFIIALSALIKRLAVDHLHIVGDLFDRGADAECVSRGEVGGRDLRACAVDRDEGDSARGGVVIGGEVGQEVGVPAGDKDEPADAVLDERREMVELGRRTRRLRADEGDAARARDLLLEMVGKGGKDRVRQLRHDNADRRGARRVFTGWTVVAQLIDRRQDSAARVFGDLADAVENA